VKSEKARWSNEFPRSAKRGEEENRMDRMSRMGRGWQKLFFEKTIVNNLEEGYTCV
jgi:hypothetical protein